MRPTPRGHPLLRPRPSSTGRSVSHRGAVRRAGGRRLRRLGRPCGAAPLRRPRRGSWPRGGHRAPRPLRPAGPGTKRPPRSPHPADHSNRRTWLLPRGRSRIRPDREFSGRGARACPASGSRRQRRRPARSGPCRSATGSGRPSRPCRSRRSRRRWRVVELVEAVQHGLLRIGAHAGGPHLVDHLAGVGGVVEALDALEVRPPSGSPRPRRRCPCASRTRSARRSCRYPGSACPTGPCGRGSATPGSRAAAGTRRSLPSTRTRGPGGSAASLKAAPTPGASARCAQPWRPVYISKA